MTIQYAQKVDGTAEHRESHTVVTSSQHVEPLKAVRSKEVAGHSCLAETDPSAEVELQETCEVLDRSLPVIVLVYTGDSTREMAFTKTGNAPTAVPAHRQGSRCTSRGAVTG